MSWMNFADAEEQTDGELIPNNTLAKVHLKIRPGGYDDPAQGWTGGWATRSERTGAVYLDAEYTIIGGRYNKRKVWSLIGLYSTKGPKWGQMGRSFVRAMLESARGVRADDVSEAAMTARCINGIGDLNGLEFVAKIEVEPAEPGSDYGDKNKINRVIGVTNKDYAALMNGNAPAAAPAQAAIAAAAVAQAPSANTGKPAWAD